VQAPANRVWNGRRNALCNKGKTLYGLVRAAVCGLLMIAPGTVSTATLTATCARDVSFAGFEGAVAGQTAFVIDFDDSLGSTTGVLEEVEFTSFAWVNNPFTRTIADPSFGEQFRTLLGNVPGIAGVSERFLIPHVTQPTSLQDVNWIFRQATASSTVSNIAVSAFTYSVTLPPPVDPVDPSVVPLPAAGWMPLAGVGGLAALRRRRGA